MRRWLTSVREKIQPELADVSCPNLRRLLRQGARQEDDPYRQNSPLLGPFFFHFSPALHDVVLTRLDDTPLGGVFIDATCSSVGWGHASVECEGSLDAPALDYKDSSGLRSNPYRYDRVIDDLGAEPGSPAHDRGLVGLGHYLHLLQDLTSPAHTRQDGHPHHNVITEGGYRFGTFGDPSAFEVENKGRAIPPVSGPLVPIAIPQAAFDALRTWTVTRFWSEKNLLVGPPAGPVPVAQDSLGYLLDGEEPPRRIARQIEGSDPPRYEIDRVVARAQFNELAPEAVRYTASMIDYIIRTENVRLCAPPRGERYRAVMIQPPYPEWTADWRPASINAHGHVALTDGSNAFIWDGAATTRIPTNGGQVTSIHLNDAGQIAVTLRTSNTASRVLVWNPYSQSLQDIGTLGSPTTYAMDLNNSGVVLGTSALSTGEARGFRWSEKESFQTFEWGPPGSAPFAAAMNNLGQVCGGYWIRHPAPKLSDGYAVIWNGTDTRLLPLPPKGSDDSEPFMCFDINDKGAAAGAMYDTTTGLFTAYVWNGTAFVDVGDLGEGSAQATAINDEGVVVGAAWVTAPPLVGNWHGFVWKDGRIRDLNTIVDGLEAGWIVQTTTAINNAGQIAAFLYKPGVAYRAVRLDPM